MGEGFLRQSKTKLMVIILIVVLVSFTACDMPGKTADYEIVSEIDELLKGAVEDNSWMKARSTGELEDILGAYYSDPLLSELVSDAWEFIYQPTDWYGQAKLENFDIIRYYSHRLTVCAQICETDLVNGEVVCGEGIYTIQKTGEGLRITAAQYNWNVQD